MTAVEIEVGLGSRGLVSCIGSHGEVAAACQSRECSWRTRCWDAAEKWCCGRLAEGVGVARSMIAGTLGLVSTISEEARLHMPVWPQAIAFWGFDFWVMLNRHCIYTF